MFLHCFVILYQLLTYLLLFVNFSGAEELELVQPSDDAYIKINVPVKLLSTIGKDRGIIKKYFGVNKNSIEMSEEEISQQAGYEIISEDEVTSLIKRKPNYIYPNKLQYELKVLNSVEINDPYYSRQWYTRGKSAPSINVETAWAEGITGAGVKVLVIDDSTDFTHPDLKGAEYRVLNRNYLTGTMDTKPTVVRQGHGTMVSGILGARGGNGSCGVGIAPNTKIGCRVAIFPGSTLYALLSSFENVKNADIITNSWGFDNCDYEYHVCFCTPNSGIESSFSSLARSGNGIIILFASGNEGYMETDVNYSPLTRHPDVITVGAVGNDCRAAAYETKGKALFITGPSEGGKGSGSMPGIVAPTSYPSGGKVEQSCTASMNGTSAACPAVAGVVALIRQVNSTLTPTDVKRILAATSTRLEEKDKSWLRNAAGIYYSSSYGFGYVNAGKAVELAKKWTRCGHSSSTVTRSRSGTVNIGDTVEETFTVSDKNNIVIESVRVLLGIETANLLGMSIYIVSPRKEKRELVTFKGSDVVIYYPYSIDSDNTSFLTWEFWGEQAAGTWTVIFDNTDNTESVLYEDVRLEFIGQPSPFILNPVLGETASSIRVPLRVVSRQEAKQVFGDTIRGDVYLYSEKSPDPVPVAKNVDLASGDLVIQWDETLDNIAEIPPIHCSNSLRAVIVPNNARAATYLTCNSFSTPLTGDGDSGGISVSDGFDKSTVPLVIYALPILLLLSLLLWI